MLAAIVHLSDLHLTEWNAQLGAKHDRLAAAIAAADSQCRHYIIVLSGDIVFSGNHEEYLVAKRFIHGVKAGIIRHVPGADVHFVSVPGNHDCVLPEKETTLRSVLIAAIEPSLQTGAPDAAILQSLLDAQKPYFAFCQELDLPDSTPYARLCTSHKVDVGPERLQFILYNTALLSQRKEEQGQLSIPIEIVRGQATVDTGSAITVSVYHHPYSWLQADIGIAFRNLIENTSEIALTGHQHSDHAFVKHALTGERLLYSEGDVFYEPGKPNESGFRVILVDLQQARTRAVSHRWNGTYYGVVNDSDWKAYTRTALGLALPAATPEFLNTLSDSGVGLTHKLLGPVPLDTVFVYPEVTISGLGEDDKPRNIKGDQLQQYLRDTSKVVIRGSAYSGKSSLAKMIVRQWLRERSFFPLLVCGEDIRQSDDSSFMRLINASAVKVYGEGGRERYHQLSIAERALVIDDWDESRLGHEDRDKFLRRALSHFGKVVLFVSGMSYIQYLMSRVEGRDVFLEFSLLSLNHLSHVSRGALIEKWLSMKMPRESPDYSRRVVETERLVQSVIGKNTLPSVPLIVLAILEAAERSTDVLPENGPFGYL